MAKCCCAPEINSAKLQVLNAIAANGRVIPQFIPPRPTVFPAAEEIARRVVDLLNKPENDFERATQQQLDAIVNALITLKARPDYNSQLNQILRNQNDIFDLQRQNQRDLNIRIDALATREQAKDLLQAIRMLREEMLQQFRFSARELSIRFAAIGAAILALGLAQKAAFVAEIAAKAAQTATILRAILGLRQPQQREPRLDEIIRKLKDIADEQLILEPVTTSVPLCNPNPQSGSAIVSQPIESFVIKNKDGDSTFALLESLAAMNYDLLASGKLECEAEGQLQSEQIGSIDGDSSNSDSPIILFPQSIQAKYFTIQLTEIDSKFIRTYKLAGNQSEYGAGNWAIVDGGGRVSGDFARLFTQNQRLDVLPSLGNAGIRLSLKRGVSASITAYGTSNQ